MKSFIGSTFFFIGVLVGYFIHPSPTPAPLAPNPRGYLISYQAGITNNMTKIANIIAVGHPFNEQGLNAAINQITTDTNIVKGSVVILNAIPVY
jgi:hypothetical protein